MLMTSGCAIHTRANLLIGQGPRRNLLTSDRDGHGVELPVLVQDVGKTERQTDGRLDQVASKYCLNFKFEDVTMPTKV